MLILFPIFFPWGVFNVSRIWVPEENDVAQKTWVSGDCRIVDHNTIYKESGGKRDWRTCQAQIRVQRLNEYVGASKVDVSLDVAPWAKAYKYPYMSRSEDARANSDATWFDCREIKYCDNLNGEYAINDTVTCFWDPDETRRVSLRNDGGDKAVPTPDCPPCNNWASARMGIVMLSVTVLIFVVNCLLHYRF